MSFTLRWSNGRRSETLNYGSGFFLSERYVATAYHVAKALETEEKRYGSTHVTVVIQKSAPTGDSEFTIPAKLVATDQLNDLAIYSFNVEELKEQWRDFTVSPLPIDDKLPAVGDEVLLTGYHSNYTAPFSSIGIVSMITKSKFTEGDTIYDRAIFSDLTTIPGHSGGPLFSLRTRRVVGLSIQVLTPDNGRARVAIATNSGHLKKLFEMAEQAKNDNEEKSL